MENDNDQPRIAYARNKARSLLKELNISTPPILLHQVVEHLQKTQDLKIAARNMGNKISGIQAIEGETSFIAYNITQHQHITGFGVLNYCRDKSFVTKF